MSDFVLNMVRRGAGLAPQTSVQPTARSIFEPALPSEREGGTMEESILSPTPNATRPGDPSETMRPVDGPLPVREIEPQSQPAAIHESDTAPVRTGDAPAIEVVAAKPFAPVLPMAAMPGEPDRSGATQESPNAQAASPVPRIDPQAQVEVESGPALVTPRARQTPQGEFESAVEEVVPADAASGSHDHGEPRSEQPLAEPLAGSAPTPRQTAPPADTHGEATSPKIKPVVASPPAPVTITPAPTPPPPIDIPLQRGADASQQRPVHVRIGTIEVKATTPRVETTQSAYQPPPPSRTQGFESFRRLRNYLN